MAVLVERAGTHGRILLDRPERAHAYDRAHLEALEAAIIALEGEVAVMVIGSTGDRAFCGGADLGALSEADPLDALDLYSQRVFTRLAKSPCLTIAAVHGPAVAGGCELTLACDLRLVGPRARFKLPETSLGIIPSAGGTTRLTRLCGASVAKQVILAGAEIDAERAIQLGLAMGPVHADPRAASDRLAEELSSRDPVAIRLAKQIIDRGEESSSLEAERVAEALLYSRRSGRQGHD